MLWEREGLLVFSFLWARGGEEREWSLRWMTGRDISSSDNSVSSSIRSSSSSSSSGAPKSSLKSTKPTPAGWATSGGPFFRLPFRFSVTAPVPTALVVVDAPPSVFFLPNRNGTDCVDA